MGIAYRFVALSDHWTARLARRMYHGLLDFSVPAPKAVTAPVLALLILFRTAVNFIRRALIAEPLFKALCAQYGKNLHTGVHTPWVQGKGDLVIGDNVMVDGGSTFFFAVRYAEKPRLTIGDNTEIGHHCSFTVGKEIRIGKHCRFGSHVIVFDAPGHATDPAARRAGQPSAADEVRPVVIGDNVWIGSNAIVFPGVTIGEGSIVAMGSVVMGSVPPNTIVAGNPARPVRSLDAAATC